MNTMLATPTSDDFPAGGRLISVGGVALPLLGSKISATAHGGRARVQLTQTFLNAESAVLEVVYKVPLPADGAVCGYRFVIGASVVEGEVHRTREAKERYEQAIMEGRTAALLEQVTSSVFTQTLGNIPPGETIEVQLTIDHPLVWREEGSWEWRFPTVIAPRYLANTSAEQAKRLQIDVSDAPLASRFGLHLSVSDTKTGDWSSPSHALVPTAEGVAVHAAQLDRDVVVRWPVAVAETGVSMAVARPVSNGEDATDPSLCAYAQLGLVPPKAAPKSGVPRDVVLLLDISGSMGGQPLQQAVSVVSALVRGLGPEDYLEMITFGSRVRRWKRASVRVDAETREEACRWLQALRAQGGTEMHSGIREAVSGTPAIHGVQRQILLVTDGYIGSEEVIMREILAERPDVTRVHTLAVGHAPNRTLTAGVARAGGGVETFVTGPQDEVAQAADTLLKRMQCPLVVDVNVSGSALLDVANRRVPDLFAGSPANLYARVRPEGGTLTIEGRTAKGAWSRTVTVPATKEGFGDASIATAWARARVETLELQRIGGQPAAVVDSSITQLGLTFSIATRLTSWLAVSKEILVDGTTQRKTIEQPHEIPAGVQLENFGLRSAQGVAPGGAVFAAKSMPMPAPVPVRHKSKARTLHHRIRGTGARNVSRPPMDVTPSGEQLFELNSQLEDTTSERKSSPLDSTPETAPEAPKHTPSVRTRWGVLIALLLAGLLSVCLFVWMLLW